jgi:small subunit ribosomal protein S20
LPVTKSAKKQMRVSERKRLRNQPIRSQCKTSITRAERLIFSGELEEAQKAVVAAISTLDKAAEKGVIHANNAARRKARLMKKLNEALSSSSVEEPAPAPASEADEPE